MSYLHNHQIEILTYQSHRPFILASHSSPFICFYQTSEMVVSNSFCLFFPSHKNCIIIFSVFPFITFASHPTPKVHQRKALATRISMPLGFMKYSHYKTVDGFMKTFNCVRLVHFLVERKLLHKVCATFEALPFVSNFFQNYIFKLHHHFALVSLK